MLARAAFRLCTAFEAAEKSHRTGLGQTGAEKKVYLPWHLLYRCRSNVDSRRSVWTITRRSLLVVSWWSPTPSIPVPIPWIHHSHTASLSFRWRKGDRTIWRSMPGRTPPSVACSRVTPVIRTGLWPSVLSIRLCRMRLKLSKVRPSLTPIWRHSPSASPPFKWCSVAGSSSLLWFSWLRCGVVPVVVRCRFPVAALP